MDEKQKNENSGWYQPYTPGQDEPEVTDLFEEAGLYRVSREPERVPAGKTKSRRTAVIVLIGIVVLALAIVLTSMLFGGEDTTADYDDGFYDEYRKYFEQEQSGEGTGINRIPRADCDSTVQLVLHDSDNLRKLSLQELYARCAPGVVGILTYANDNPLGWGTGVVMTEDGYIVTNTHVLDNSDSVTVRLYDGREFDALLVGGDAISDISVLKIDATGLTAAEFGNSEQVQVGDDAIAIGNPLSERFSFTMTTGIISGVSRDMDYKNRTMSLLQTNAALNPGNSGGALFNAYGQVVGITNMKMMGSFVSVVEGVGFAIPSTTVKQMVDAILKDGAVKGRPGLGIMVIDLNGGTEEVPDGMLVNTVYANSDAEAKGLQAEDVITEIDGKAATDITVVRDVINGKSVGDTVHLKIWRDGEILELDIALIDQNDFVD